MSALDGQATPVHRIRHIHSVQIRNLTPFPARDALTTALAQPAPAQGTKQAAADDIELTIARRKRRISTASTGTLRSVFSADVGDDLRPRLGHRASSSASSKKTLVQPPAAPAKSVLPSVLSDGDSSQRGLEKVIASRLLETFVTFSALAHPEPPSSPVLPLSPTRRDRAPSIKRTVAVPPSRRGASISSIASVTARPLVKTDGLASRTATKTTLKSPTQAARRVPLPVSPPPTPRNSMFIPPSPSSSTSMPPPRPPDEPFFKSPVHRPSTNPSFDVSDAKPSFIDLSSSKVVITLWGRTVLDPDTLGSTRSRRKGKERAPSPSHLNEWKVLCEYDLDLNDLRPLPAEYTTHPSRLPSNTLLVHLTPPDQTFYLPPPSSRPSSPDGDAHLSEGELDTIRGSPKRQRRKSLQNQPPPPPAKTRTTATWHDLHKLVHLQSTLADTQQNLEKIVAHCDALLAADASQPAKREVSEREERLRSLREQRDAVRAQCRTTESTIMSRRKELEERRQMLASARQILEQENADYDATAALIAEQQEQRGELAKSTEAQRADLLSTLSTVYPIEPLSAPDLLFTIVGVALPVPQNNTDPAPPLSLTLPEVEVEVNEETIAAALGYTAQLVQLMARYLGRRLMYPITCIGSRSLIKDPISAMMGPRMFPLYSKGVETYRFEYAVFLLNKDIELIMMDRNLRALDLRHTLPNLMNLLLTLTRPDAEPPHKHRRRPVSPQLSVKELHPPARQPSEAEVIHDLPPDPQPQSTPALERRSMFSPLAAMLRARYPSSAARVAEPPPAVPASTSDGDTSLTVPDTPKPAAEEPVANGNANGKSSVPSSPVPPPPPPPTPALRTTSRMGGMFGRFMGGGGGAAEKAKPAAVEAEAVASPPPTPAAVSG
ncbi:hypothetical protein AURDEDRAFT_179009 [Auricularia subglabra TFB-10046 SS5]|nr:hypothetical protein AURDEDRAFT_179009 [Auricularia subglabra TFB-10046 SS5]